MKSQLLKKQLIAAKLATGGKVGGDDKGKKYKSKEEARKNATVVKSESDVPAGAKKVVNPDGSVTFYIESKSEAPPVAKPADKKPSGGTVKKAMAAPTGKPAPKKTTPTKQPPVNQQQVEAFTIPAPVKQKVGPGAAVGYIGEVRQDFSAGTVGNVDLGNKKVPIQQYLLPGQYNTKTKKWDVEGAWGNPTRLYGYEGVNGDFVPIEMNYLNPKTSGVYSPNELPAWGNPNLAKQMVAEGAPTVTDGATVNDIKVLGGDPSNLKEVNYQRNMYEGTLGKKMGVDKPVVEVKKDVVPASGLPIGGFKKGGLLGKYAGGGPIVNPNISVTQYYDQLQKVGNNNGLVNVNQGTTVDPVSNPKKGLLGKLSSVDKQSTGNLLDVVGTASSSILDAADRKDGRSSIAGQTGSGLLKGAGKGAAIGLNPALMAATGGLSAPIGAIAGGVLGATTGAIRGTKEKKARQSAVAQDVADNVSNMSNQPFDANAPSEYRSELYNKKDFRKGIAGLFSKGGQIKGPGTGTSDSVKANIEGDSFVVPAKNADIAKKIRKHMLGKEEKAELNQKGGVPVKVSNGEHLFTPEEVKELSAAGINLDALAPDSKSKLRSQYKCGGKIPMGYADGGPVGVPNWASMYKKQFAKKTSKPKSLLDLVKYTAPTVVPGEGEDDIVVPQAQSTPVAKTGKELLEEDRAKLLNDSALKAQAELDAAKQNPLSTASNRTGYGLGDAIGLGLGTLQAGFGLQQLLKDKRPIGKVDPDFDNQTNQALANSKYGYTPQQKALLQDQIVQNRINQQASVNAMAGGNAAVGLSNMRSAINNQVRNQLQLASEDERLRLQKQQYAAGLSSQRAGMRRQLFEDNLSKFMQNQQTGAALLGSGLQNIVGAQRYAQEKLAQDQINKMMYQPVIIQP